MGAGFNRERMIFGKEATFVLNILPAKIHKVKPETKKEKEKHFLG